MKNMQKIFSVIAAMTLAVSLPAEMMSTTTFAAVSQQGSDREQLTITDEAGLIKFAKACSLDSYSKNLYVTLAADIELSGEFAPIATFGGVFDGAGHTISELKITGDGSYAGLFRYIQRGALVKDLTVKGTVSPAGSAEYVGGIAGSNSGNITGCTFSGKVKGTSNVGGIAGINEKSGLISGCSASGVISGDHSSGGIAGSSSGTLLNDTSRCSVNTTASEAKLSIEDIDWDSIMSSEEPSYMTDAGGITGYSDGIIQGCENYGTVGYPHIGYNIGGIVGRQSGYVNSCANRGEIFGRKDVGGIAGQMEPYQSIDFDKDTVQKLLDEMDVLGGLVDNLIDDAKGAGDAVNDKVQGLTWQMDNLRRSADDISDRTTELYNGWTDGVNEISARVDEALDGVGPALDGFRDGLDLLSQFSNSLEEVFDQITASSDDMQAALDEGKEGIDTLNGAITEISGALDDISAAADNIAAAMGDTDKVTAAVKDMIKALGNANGEVKNIVTALNKIGDACDKLEEWVTGRDFENLSDGIADLGESMQDVTKALSKMSSALQKIAGSIDADEIQKGLDEFSSASVELGKAAAHAAAAIKAASGTVPDTDKVSEELSAAADNIQAAGEHITKASDAISKAVDSKELSAGISQLETAANELSKALDDAGDAIDDITDAYKKISSSSVPDDTYKEISKQLDNINTAIDNIAKSSDTITDALNVMTDQLDSGALKDGIESISDAADKLAAASDTISDSIASFDKAADYLSDAMDDLQGASTSASDASAFLAKACDAFSKAMDQLSKTVKTLSDKPAVEFPAADADFTAALDGFSNNFAGITSALSSISSTAEAQGDILLDDFQKISDEMSNITDILQELKDKVLNNDDDSGIATDVSEDDSTSRQGKALSCVNYGGVQGDLNVGGITGSMAIDVDFDPEDDISSNGQTSFSFSYKIRDIIDSCINSGEIVAKKNYCGGIVGRQDMGVVRNSTENGKVTSSSGSYAGGIAGYSVSAIRNCVSKVTITGADYVGGIAGQGLILTDNSAILDAYDCKERCGSIAGYVDFSDDNAEVLRNSFVDRGIAGIDGISYSGKAAPVDFEKFAAAAGSTAVIDVKFIVDGDVINTVSVSYGGSLRASDFPEIPAKDGCFAEWTDFDSSFITFPVEVEAIYTPYVTVIESGEQSETGFPLVLADGLFDDGSTLKVSTQSSSVFAPDNNSELRLVTISGNVKGSVTQLRFLAPEGRGTVNVMQFVNGAWKNVEFTENGHYLIVTDPALDGNSGFFCVQLQQLEWIPVVIIGGCVLIALINIVLWTILIKRKHAAKKAKSAKSDAPDNSTEQAESAEQSKPAKKTKKNRKKPAADETSGEEPKEKEPAESK